MRKDKKDLSNKKRGSIMKMLPVLLAMAVVAIMTTMYISYMSVGDVREKADQLAREYILLMETKGYLNDEAKNNLLIELQDIGLSNISLMGTSVSQVEYGSEIVLNISASLIIEQVCFDDIFKPQKKQQIYHLNISKKTTAKC